MALLALAVWLRHGHALAQGLNISEQYLLSAANQDRAAIGLTPLKVDSLLNSAAKNHAQQMVFHHGISHQFSKEADLADRVAASGARFSLVTENVAEASNSTIIHELWMHSAGHRANLLDARVDVIGIAVLMSGGLLYAVEDFARSVPRLTYEDQESRVTELLTPWDLESTAGSSDARQTCSMHSGYVGNRQPWFVMRYTADDLSHLPSQLLSKLETRKYHHASVGACKNPSGGPFSSFAIAILLYP